MTSLLSTACSHLTDKPDDPYLWLEDIYSDASLNWARQHNEKSVAIFTKQPIYQEIEPKIREILTAKDRIPFPNHQHGQVYNFWQDGEHVKGLWRTTSMADYASAHPKWKVLLDVDALSKTENESWVFHGADCLPPKGERCLMQLSRGGKDAALYREFDLVRNTFVADGFALPEAKSDMAWIDLDTVLVSTDFGPGSLTSSGYPRIVKKWKRGTPLEQAETLMEGEPTDMSLSGWTSHRPEGIHSFISRRKSFYEGENFLLQKDGTLFKLPFPDSANFEGVFHGYALAILRFPWQVGKKTIPEGALVSLPLDRLTRPDEALEILYAPGERASIQHVSLSKNFILVATLDNVKGRLLRAQRTQKGWATETLPFPDHGEISIVSIDAFDDQYFAQFQSFLIPTSLYLGDLQSKQKPRVVQQLPPRFDASSMVTEQKEAVSRDGTKVPYFVVYKKGLKLDGSNPTLLYGYGGFEIGLTPWYLSTAGKVWLDKGGIYVVANIRGGGEFGPKWHQAALKENRQRAYDDFIAVAEELIRQKLTSPKHLGIQGGSNGGLLVGAVFVQRPDLFNAVICQVPLLDMLRYHHLLAGASWMAEYGNPDDPADAQAILAIRRYSPYQNVKRGVKYPRIFFYTSTRDDRVHPGHARKMVARMEEQGHDVLYYENIEGGHGGSADLDQLIRRIAMDFTYLFMQLDNKN
ncbi:MAG: hypothetical protein A2X86_02350 [Bdellovibrionales bacterium GWA2_49_15]|nr:MAG: hypothetical protein A2X86_02350 [Bdellovibrionales bacterium GWA2_49_15]